MEEEEEELIRPLSQNFFEYKNSANSPCRGMLKFPRSKDNPSVYLQYTFSIPSVYLQYTFSTPSVHLQYTFSTPSVYLQYTFSIPSVYLQYTSVYLQYTFSIPSVYLQYTFSTPSVHLQYTFSTPSVYLQYTFSIPSVYLQYTSVYLQYTFSIPSVYLQYTSSIPSFSIPFLGLLTCILIKECSLLVSFSLFVYASCWSLQFLKLFFSLWYLRKRDCLVAKASPSSQINVWSNWIICIKRVVWRCLFV